MPGNFGSSRPAPAFAAAIFMIAGAAAGESTSVVVSSYHDSMEAGLYGEAVTHAKHRIDRVLANEPVDRTAWARALTDLAEAQIMAADWRAAADNFAQAVELLEAKSNRLDQSLIRPLTGLARAKRAAGDYPAAVGSFKRAIHLQQVNFGPHAIEQAESVDTLSRIYFETGDFERANAMQQVYVTVHRQTYPDDFLQQLPALYSQAEMFTRTSRYFDARKAYLQILSGIEKQEGRRSLALLPAIFRFADLLETHHIRDGRDGVYVARRYLRRAVHIAESRDDASPVVVADAYIAMGDFFARRTGDRRTALRYYERGWNALSGDERYDKALAERFGQALHLNPLPVDTVPLMRNLLTSAVTGDEPEPEGRIVATFDVDAGGIPQNITVTESDPTGYWDPIVVDHIEKFVFRPAFSEGRPVRSEGFIFEIGAGDSHARADLGQNGAGVSTPN